MKKFKDVSEDDKRIISNMCSLIEKQHVFVVASGKRWKLLSRESENYTYDYTYNLVRFGFAKKAKGTDFAAQLHKYCPNQDISGSLSYFLNCAVDSGLYVRETNKKFDGGTDFQVIWM